MKTLSHIIFLASPLPALQRWLPADAPRGQADPSIILWHAQRVAVEALRLGCWCRLPFAVSGLPATGAGSAVAAPPQALAPLSPLSSGKQTTSSSTAAPCRIPAMAKATADQV